MKEIYAKFLKLYEEGKIRDFNELSSEPYFAWHADVNDFLVWNQNLREFAQLCQREHLECLLLLTPMLHYTPEEYHWKELHTLVTAVAQAHAINVFDLEPIFRKVEDTEVRVDLAHPNAAGHFIIAKMLFRYLKEELKILG